jgi:hypothetical protein
LFQVDLDNPPENYYEIFRPYQFDGELGSKPWFPPLSQCWLEQGVPVSYDAGHADAWSEAWKIVQQAHAEWLAAQK